MLMLLLAAALGLPTVPGATNPAVTQSNIHQTICVPGWSKTQRPPTSYTNPIKMRLMDAAGISRSLSKNFELDHDISIELGGSPTSLLNLWLEPYFGPENAHDKDKVENFLHKEVCADKLPLAQAQRMISTNWEAVKIN